MNNRNKEREQIKFTKRLKEALVFRGLDKLSLAELREVLGYSRTTIHKWLNEDAMPSIYSAADLAKKIHVDYEWLLTGNGVMEGFQLQSASEAALIEQFRNLTKQGQLDLITAAFDLCKKHEKVAKNREDKQIALTLVKKKH